MAQEVPIMKCGNACIPGQKQYTESRLFAQQMTSKKRRDTGIVAFWRTKKCALVY